MKIFSLFLVLLSTSAWADKPNCKITVKSVTQDGANKVSIEEIHTATREECKQAAHLKEAGKAPEIANIRAAFSFKEVQ